MNDQWQLAALHHAGVPDEDAAGNWLRTDGGIFRPDIDDPSTVKWIANEGVRISRIVGDMRARSLSDSHRALFDGAFTPVSALPVFTPGVAEGGVPVGAGPGNTRATAPGGGLTVGPDGMARWTFQLSFGPVGGGAVGGAKQLGSGSGDAQIAGPTPAVPSVPAAADRGAQGLIESVFDRRGQYYDEESDRAAAAAYYEGIEAGLTKSKRYAALRDLLARTHTMVLSYSSARHAHLYPWIDRQEDETLRSIYSGEPMAEELFVAELSAFEAAIERAAAVRETTVETLSAEVVEAEDAALETTSMFNCEHVVPQSWFEHEAEQRAQKSDLHHLFTCESGCNSFRSNIPYSEFTEEEEAAIRAAEVSPAEALRDSTLEAARPQCGLRDQRRFEPSAGKGAVARATLYFVLRYPGVVGDVKSGRKKELLKSNTEFLIAWAEAEPPSRYERHRNAEIARVQGNRNPLIDRPDWLRKIAFEEGFG